ncbi:MAG: hypothetical protein ABI821_13730 [Pseudomonadota bacterium]
MNDPVEDLLRTDPLRPRDAGFTQRVLIALPPRARRTADSRRSFELANRSAVTLALLVVAQRWYVAGAGSPESLLALLLFLAPALAAVSRLCGPLIPRSLWRVFRPGSGNWR